MNCITDFKLHPLIKEKYSDIDVKLNTRVLNDSTWIFSFRTMHIIFISVFFKLHPVSYSENRRSL